MNDLQNLMYDMILESLVNKVDDGEISIEEADIFSEAVYDEIFTEGEKLDNLKPYGKSFAHGAAAAAGGLAAYGAIKATKEGLNKIKNRIDSRKGGKWDKESMRIQKDSAISMDNESLKECLKNSEEYMAEIKRQLASPVSKEQRRELQFQLRQEKITINAYKKELARRGI